jgi:dGTPase
MKNHGGFDHNAQSLRVVTELERHYAQFQGVNLTWDTLEGLVKHNGPLTDREGRPIGRYRDSGLPVAIQAYQKLNDLELWSFASAEAQAAALADDIAYDAHDIDDGLRAELFTFNDIAQVPVLGEILREIAAAFPDIEPARRAHELVRRVITRMIEDVIAESRRRLEKLAPKSVADIRMSSHPVVAFSAATESADKGIKGFLYPRMYRHPRVERIMGEAEGVLRDLFVHYMEKTTDMPVEWAEGLSSRDEHANARRTADYIAGMTDRYALIEHAKYFKFTPELR